MSPFRQLTLTALSALLALSLALPAQARDRHRSGSYVTNGGASGTYDTRISGNLRKGLNREQCFRGSRGKSFNRSAHTTYNRKNGDLTHTVVGPDGNIRTINGALEDGHGSGNYATSTGKSGTWKGARTRNGDGTVTRNGSITTSSGRTYNATGTYGYDRKAKTLYGQGVGPLGKEWDGSVTVTPDPRR